MRAFNALMCRVREEATLMTLDPIGYLVRRGCQTAALALLALYAFFVCELFLGSIPAALANGWYLLTGTSWDPTREILGLWALIYGTLTTTGIAMAIGIPVGREIAIATVLYRTPLWVGRLGASKHFVPSKLGNILNSILSPRSAQLIIGVVLGTLVGMPSILVGIWALKYLAPLMPAGYQYSLGTASLVLTVIVTPLIAMAYRSAFLSVPNMRGQMEAAIASGFHPREAVKFVLIPHKKFALMAMKLGIL